MHTRLTAASLADRDLDKSTDWLFHFLGGR
ncbi:MAG: hypothetical protein ACI814_001112, partial [Mariniblastus sp.]